LPEEEKEVQRLADEGFVLVVAGAETTSKILSTVIYHLLANPDSLARVRGELDVLMPDPKQLADWKMLEQLEYLVHYLLYSLLTFPLCLLILKSEGRSNANFSNIQNAVVNEGLRLSGAVLNRLPLIEPVDVLHYKGWAIPPGTPVSMSIPSILMDPDIFSEPRMWKPERWEEDKELGKWQIAFARGSRSCPGQK